MMPTFCLPATVLRSLGEWPCTSALGLLTRKYSALSSNVSPLSNAIVSALPSLRSRNSVGQGVDAPSLMPLSLVHFGKGGKNLPSENAHKLKSSNLIARPPAPRHRQSRRSRTSVVARCRRPPP